MGMSGLSLGHMFVVLLVVVLVFGTKRLGSIGADLGEAIKGFRKAMASDDDGPKATGDGGPPPAGQGTRSLSADAAVQSATVPNTSAEPR